MIVLYTSNPEDQFSFVKKAKERGYDVLHLDGPLASHWISKMEQSLEQVSFVRVDADSLDKLIKKTDEIPSKLSKEEEEKLKPVFESNVAKEKFTVQFESMSESEAPIIITQPEFIRRMMEQQRLGGAGFYGAFPEMYNLSVNANHPLVGTLLQKNEEEQQAITKQLVDLALLAQGMLKGEALDQFIQRNIEHIA
jgi:molecular chaperone HtpG